MNSIEAEVYNKKIIETKFLMHNAQIIKDEHILINIEESFFVNLDYNFGTLLVKSIIEFQTITNNLLVIKKENKSTNNSTIITDSNNPKFNNINLISHNLNNNDNSNIDINLNTSIKNSSAIDTEISFSNISMEKDTQVNTNN